MRRQSNRAREPGKTNSRQLRQAAPGCTAGTSSLHLSLGLKSGFRVNQLFRNKLLLLPKAKTVTANYNLILNWACSSPAIAQPGVWADHSYQWFEQCALCSCPFTRLLCPSVLANPGSRCCTMGAFPYASVLTAFYLCGNSYIQFSRTLPMI
jgi:hypothetical protein